jgi:hypothetical protein
MFRGNHCALGLLKGREKIVSPLLLVLLSSSSTKLRFCFLCVRKHVAISLAQNLLWHKSSVFQNLPLPEGSSETDLLKAATEINEIIKRSYRYKRLF